MGVFAQIDNTCNHCGEKFVYAYSTTICPRCFLEGHRFGDCGPHCKATDATKAQVAVIAEALARKKD